MVGHRHGFRKALLGAERFGRLRGAPLIPIAPDLPGVHAASPTSRGLYLSGSDPVKTETVQNIESGRRTPWWLELEVGLFLAGERRDVTGGGAALGAGGV